MTEELPPVDDAARAQLGQVAGLVRERLGDAVAGAYLYGSAVSGGLKTDSDLDVLAVASRPTTAGERRGLVERLLEISGRHAVGGPARSIELTIVAQADVRPWRYPPRLDFQYGDWLRPAFERGDPAPWRSPDPDLAVLLTMVRATGHPLVGPPAPDVLDPVPRADLERALLDVVDGLLEELETDERNVVLTLARIWRTIATGDIVSKDEAAAWALERLPAEHRPVLARARAIYLGEEPERWDDLRPSLRPHAQVVVRQVRSAATR